MIRRLIDLLGMRELIEYADYLHHRWGHSQMQPNHPQYTRVCLRLYEYRRTYGWP